MDDEDEDDFDGEDFEAKYLSSGINLDAGSSTVLSKIEKNRQAIIDEVKSNVTDLKETTNTSSPLLESSISLKQNTSLTSSASLSQNQSNEASSFSKENSILVDSISSDLTKIAIQHLDKHQWQLPLMEMDKKFRDKTYYKHYTDTYISSLRSKLGHFMADNQLVDNPMRYHIQQELDNYSKYSRMFALLTEYYQSIGSSFFTFATPSPDEEIVIGCRLGTKGYYRPYHHTI